MTAIKVCVIGAGAAGLNASRQLTKFGIEHVVLEKSTHIAGTWWYENCDPNEFGEDVHSSMYRDLRTNLPVESMAFPDFEFPYTHKDQRSFPHHNIVLQYLNDYCEHFDLKQNIRFRCRVNSVSRKHNEWAVAYTRNNAEKVEESFDAVIVCVGRYSKPLMPSIQGLDSFRGFVRHSHTYRTREPYIDETVVIVGAGPSGIDLALEVCTVAKHVYLCHRNKKQITAPLPCNMTQINTGIHSVCNRSVIFNDVTGNKGLSVEVNGILLCTGYELHFSFFDSSCGLVIKEGSVLAPMYKHLINISHPTSFFVMGLPNKVIPFPLFHYQTELICSILLKRTTLPSPEEMLNDAEKDLQSRLDAGMKFHQSHALPDDYQWEYVNSLVEMTPSLTPYSNLLKEMYDRTHNERQANVMNYRDAIHFMEFRNQKWIWK